VGEGGGGIFSGSRREMIKLSSVGVCQCLLVSVGVGPSVCKEFLTRNPT